MAETRWNNFELLTFSDGSARLNVGISSPSDSEVSSRSLFQISIGNDTIRHNLNLGYSDCLELDVIFSKLRDKSFLSKLFNIVQTKGVQEVVRTIKGKVFRVSFFISRDGEKAAKVAIYSNPNDILEVTTPLAVVLSLGSLLASYIERYIEIVMGVHTIRRLDEILKLSRDQVQELNLVKLNLNNLTNESVLQAPRDRKSVV